MALYDAKPLFTVPVKQKITIYSLEGRFIEMLQISLTSFNQATPFSSNNRNGRDKRFPLVRIKNRKLTSARFIKLEPDDKKWIKKGLETWPESESRIFLTRSRNDWLHCMEEWRDGIQFYCAQKGKRLLGLAETHLNKSANVVTINLIDVNPEEVYDNRQRSVKGIGRGLMWGLLKETPDKHFKFAVDAGAEGFYQKIFGENNPFVSRPNGVIHNEHYNIPPKGVIETIEKIEQRPEYRKLLGKP